MEKKYLDEENIGNKGTLTENEGTGETQTSEIQVEPEKGILGSRLTEEDKRLRDEILNLLNKVYPEKELFSIHLAKTNDIDELITLLQKTSENDKPLVEFRIKEVLEEKLKTIYDRSNLISMLGKVPEKFKPLVESRIIDCCNQKTIRFSNEDTLKSVVTYLVSSMGRGEIYISKEVDDALYDYFADLTRIERIKAIVTIRNLFGNKVDQTEGLLKKELSKISKIDILITMRSEALEEFKPLVESRIKDVLKTFTDLNILITMRSEASEEFKPLVESRIKDVLPLIFDEDMLLKASRDSEFTTSQNPKAKELRRLIMDRMNYCERSNSFKKNSSSSDKKHIGLTNFDV